MGKAGGGNSAGLFGDDDAVLNELASALDFVEQSFLVRVVPCGFVEGASSPCNGRIISSGCDGLVGGDGALRDALVLGRHDSDASSLLELRLVWAHQRDDRWSVPEPLPCWSQWTRAPRWLHENREQRC